MLSEPFRTLERATAPWREPMEVARGLKDRKGLAVLLSDGGPLGRWSWIGAEPDLTFIGQMADHALLAPLRDPAFATGVIGLLAYDAGARAATGERGGDWPDLMLARYPAMLGFDHQRREVLAVGRGANPAAARAALSQAQAWLARAREGFRGPPPGVDFVAEAPDETYQAAVADVVARIAAGELFQANIARGWTGRLRPGADPFDVLTRLAGRESAYGAMWRLGERAIVSNSPELFLTFDPADRRMETRPIKGTRPRDPDPARDQVLASELQSSAKDRAENLMIVDLMRNDLARAARPGSVRVGRLFEIERLPTVHHLVSTVTGEAAEGVGPAELLEATFPPGSITGAPKHQAMKVIADHEPPRGPWCGSLFHIDDAGRMTASVLIRTAAFEMDGKGWRFRALAGAGIVADSDPAAELAETEAKIRALREALAGPA